MVAEATRSCLKSIVCRFTCIIYEELSIKEIAKLLNRKENTIMSDLHRARKLLRESLRNIMEEKDDLKFQYCEMMDVIRTDKEKFTSKVLNSGGEKKERNFSQKMYILGSGCLCTGNYCNNGKHILATEE